jgi:hypothetical protein
MAARAAHGLKLRDASFAVRVVQRIGGLAAIVYRRRPTEKGLDRLQRVAALSPLAYTAAGGLLRDGVAAARGGAAIEPVPGRYYPLDADWGARLACYALVVQGLRNGDRLLRAAGYLRLANGNEAAWWLGLLLRQESSRALRALRILVEAVE